MTATTRTPQTLDELYEVLRASIRVEDREAYARAHGLPTAHGDIDWTSLPTFGGEEPADTSEIWSWDERRLLIGAGINDLEIVAREDA